MSNHRSNGKIDPDNFGEAFLNESPKCIYDQCISDFKNIIPLDQFEKMVHGYNQGVEQYKLEHISHLGEHRHYLWRDQSGKKALSVYFDSADLIHRLVVHEYKTFPKTDATLSEVSYTMPVKDDWLVFWGGANEFINYHYAYPSQRYAYDLLIMEKGKTHKGTPMKNENYHAFNKDIIAPAGGRVVKVLNNIPDNVPGEMNEKQPAGNYIILQHAKKEYSLLAHLKENSIKVDKGDIVQAGDTIAKSGNSGNSSEAHIHFQVMDAPKIHKCKSIPIRFNDRSSPVQGDIVTRTSGDTSKKFDPDTLGPEGSPLVPEFLTRIFK
ncbi:M23 family metallopeptidase [Salinicoccus roseus]|uniref:M23 family metallopeptidase n=1 Tax=Salinicoccus roseus TaxID=45670 RepID=UPI000FBECF67|nr:M23 family metallopeptidase [Salinicoccus roseus]RPE51808.1 peptidase M23-like protein [Salinicoccus roseus]GGA75961.1 peptidase M23 [Salinicoccus roseus]